MPSTLVHLAFAGLVASALLGDDFGKKSLAIVCLVLVIPDIDSFIPYGSTTGHRAFLHNIWIVVVPAGWLLLARKYEQRMLPADWSDWHTRVAWVAVGCLLFAHLLLDLVDGSINLFWPVYDQFYTMRGVLELSDQRGIIQTFSDGGLPLLDARGSLEEVRITTGVDPGPAVDGQPPERRFPLFRAGWQVAIFVTGSLVTVLRFWIPQSAGDAL